MERDEFFQYQIESIRDFYIHFRSYRLIYRNQGNIKSNKLFWSTLSNTSIKNLFIYWCRIFGNKSVNKTHWQQYLTKSEVDEFRSVLLQNLKMTMNEWKVYHSEMLAFRNSYVAHHDKDFKQPVPILDKAVIAMQTYEEWIKEKLAYQGIVYVDDFFSYVNPLIDELKDIMNRDI